MQKMRFNTSDFHPCDLCSTSECSSCGLPSSAPQKRGFNDAEIRWSTADVMAQMAESRFNEPKCQFGYEPGSSVCASCPNVCPFGHQLDVHVHAWELHVFG